MSIGESIKTHRLNAGLTQKDLSEKLNVSYQTVSKWETDVNEPDLSTIKEMSKIFNCSIDDLLNFKDEENEKTNNSENVVSLDNSNDNNQVIAAIKPEVAFIGEQKEEKKKVIAKCKDCGWDIYEGETVHYMNRKNKNGEDEIVPICDSCFKKHEELNKAKIETTKPINKTNKNGKTKFKRYRNDSEKKLMIWSIVGGLLALVITLIVCLVNIKKVGIGLTIGLPILFGYTILATIYCIFSYGWICEVFTAVASWSIKFPGIIFTFDFDGLKFLIVMKLLFAILGAAISVGAFLLALTLSAFFSIFTFPFLIIFKR